MKTSSRSGGNESKNWPSSQYGQAKSSISDDGDGLGKDFVKQFMPKGSAPSDETLRCYLCSAGSRVLTYAYIGRLLNQKIVAIHVLLDQGF